MDFKMRIRHVWRERRKRLRLYDRAHRRVIDGRVAGTLLDLDKLGIPISVETKVHSHRLCGVRSLVSWEMFTDTPNDAAFYRTPITRVRGGSRFAKQGVLLKHIGI
jgi:hypothetical protein